MAFYTFLKNNWLWLATGVAVIVVFHLTYGLQIIEPSNISWLMTAMHDWGAHYLGWYFYRNEPWHFPIGEIQNLYYPLGTNIGFTDSIPLFAIFLKVFDIFLPEDFQYFGIWLFLCHLLTAYFTVRLLLLFKVDRLIILMAVLFIIANPVLIYRGMHPALCAHWLLLASGYLYFLNPSVIPPKKIFAWQSLLLIIAGLISPYLVFMVLAFSLALSLRLWLFDKVLSWRNFLFYNFLALFVLLLVWFMVGMVGLTTGENYGVKGSYGLYSLNLNSLFNSFGFSSFFPALKQVSLHQYEGFMYLGAGIMILVGLILIYRIYQLIEKKKEKSLQASSPLPNRVNLIPLFALLFLLTLFSITNIVSFNDKVLFKFPIPGLIVKFGETLRASARYFWPVYYLILFWSFIYVTKSRLPRFVKLSVLAITLLVQFYDTKRLFTYRELSYGSYKMPIDETSWHAVIKNFDEIVVYPPFQGSYLINSDYQYFCYLAAKARKPVTTGYVAREGTKAAKIFSDSLNADLEEGKISANKLYITTASNLEAFSALLQSKKAQLHILDSYYYLYGAGIKDTLLSPAVVKWDARQRNKLDSALQIFGTKNKFSKTTNIVFPKHRVINYSVEYLADNEHFLTSKGWAFIDSTNNNKNDSIFFLLVNEANSYIAPVKCKSRSDVTEYFKKPYLDDAGFNALIFNDDVEKGVYQLGIAIKNKEGNWVYQRLDKIIRVRISDFARAQVLDSLPPATQNIRYNLENLQVRDSVIKLSGWAFSPTMDIVNCEISILLINSGDNYKVETERVLRSDVTSYFKSAKSLDNAGFAVRLADKSLPRGKYQIGIMIEDLKSKKKGMTLLDKLVELK